MAWAGGVLADRDGSGRVAAGASSLHCCTRSRGPGLGTRGRLTPFLTTGWKAERLPSGLSLLLLSAVSNQSGPSNFLLPFLHWLSAFSTVSLAQGSGRSCVGGPVEGLPLRSGGAILMVTGLWMRRGWWVFQSCRFSMLFGVPEMSRPMGVGLGGWLGKRLQASGTLWLQTLAWSWPGGMVGRVWVRPQRFGWAQGSRICSLPRWRRTGLDCGRRRAGAGGRSARAGGRSGVLATLRYLHR